MAEQSGFMAIQPQYNNMPKARKQLVRNPDGTTKLVLVDINTNQPVTNPAQYQVTESSNYLDLDTLGLNPTKTTQPEQKTVAQQTIQGGSDKANYLTDKPENSSVGSGSKGFMERTPANNFGYFQKPDWMSLVTIAPGMVGSLGRAAGVAANVNNMMAVNDARGMMGVPETNFKEFAQGSLKGTQGQVADVNIGKNPNTYSVGFGAMSPKGVTNLTPNEARTRGLTGGGISLATPEQSKAQGANLPDEKRTGVQGFLDNLWSKAESFVNDLFSDDVPDNYFPAKPAQYQPKESDGNNGGLISGGQGTDSFGSVTGNYSGTDDFSNGGGSMGNGKSEADKGSGGVSGGGTGLW